MFASSKIPQQQQQRKSHQRHSSSPLSLGDLASLTANTTTTSTTDPIYEEPNSINANRPASTRSNRSSSSKSSKRDFPPLFWYMEAGEWLKAEERLARHPREVKTWATLKTKNTDNGLDLVSSQQKGGTQRLALHHACFKLRSAGSSAPPADGQPDPFAQICRFILLVLRVYPEAARERETRHGCLPLHLAAFASCASRMSSTMELDRNEQASPVADRPACLSSTSRRAHSDATNLSQVNDEEESRNGGMALGVRQAQHSSRQQQESVVSIAMRSDQLQINAKREELAVQVVNALLDAYPKAVRMDSEGGRLPLHTACAGRATPRVIATLLRAYKSAARHRNKDGFLPLHLTAHWGVSHPDTALALLRTYPDATVGRNRWERTPLEEALCMAGENGRPHQAALVRALRKHPTFWTRPEAVTLFQSQMNSSCNTLTGSSSRQSSGAVDVDESLPSHDEDDVSAAQLLMENQ